MHHFDPRHLYLPIRHRALPRLAALGLLLTPLCGCSLFSAPLNYRGQAITSKELKQLVPGQTTEADATRLLGSPTSTGLFQPNRWSYMSQVTHSRIGRMPGVIQQDVVVLTFNNQGVLENVQDLGKQDEVPVAMASGATPSPGGHASFFQQLLGNVGRYSPTGQLPGQSQAFGPALGGLTGGEP